MKVWIDYLDDPDVPPLLVDVSAVPRVGEHVGVRPLNGADSGAHFALDRVVAVTHYPLAAPPETRVLTSSTRGA